MSASAAAARSSSAGRAYAEWLPPNAVDPEFMRTVRLHRPEPLAVWRDWHAELRHRNRLSGKERFARVQILASGEQHSPEAVRNWIRVGTVGDKASGWSRFAGSKYEGVNRSFAVRQCCQEFFDLTGVPWALRNEAEAWIRPAASSGRFLLHDRFAENERLAAESTAAESRKLAGRTPEAMWRLSSSEWGCVMAALACAGDILCLAATCKRMTADACQPMAWRHVHARHMTLGDLLRFQAPPPPPSFFTRVRQVFSHSKLFGASEPQQQLPRPSAFMPLVLDLTQSSGGGATQVDLTPLPAWLLHIRGLCLEHPLSFYSSLLRQRTPWLSKLVSLDLNLPRGVSLTDISGLLHALPALSRLTLRATGFNSAPLLPSNFSHSSLRRLCFAKLEPQDSVAVPVLLPSFLNPLIAAAPNLSLLLFDDAPHFMLGLLHGLLPAFVQRRTLSTAAPLLVRMTIPLKSVNRKSSQFDESELDRFLRRYTVACREADGSSRPDLRVPLESTLAAADSEAGVRAADSAPTVAASSIAPADCAASLQLQWIALSPENDSAFDSESDAAAACAKFGPLTKQTQHASSDSWVMPQQWNDDGDYQLRDSREVWQLAGFGLRGGKF